MKQELIEKHLTKIVGQVPKIEYFTGELLDKNFIRGIDKGKFTLSNGETYYYAINKDSKSVTIFDHEGKFIRSDQMTPENEKSIKNMVNVLKLIRAVVAATLIPYTILIAISKIEEHFLNTLELWTLIGIGLVVPSLLFIETILSSRVEKVKDKWFIMSIIFILAYNFFMGVMIVNVFNNL
ncbi:hypothetical protein BKP35_12280 [Anaerobacillus arseniciselenatis]|uniref:Uncharacterized protein n=1 Tax=Anaerobacillus arseniciselenatis TaxID=85682 RepID=A0A1S2LG67_9BACI|nr:hypothetical protein [Anaerobacillus arseniciselenatis]OIJ11512.1 hypothetical protein BKP35_12280 [Anaerobacillus arseniciselenatis]